MDPAPKRTDASPSLTPKRLFILGIVVALGVSYLGSVRDYLSQRDELARQQAEYAALVAERNTIRTRLGSDKNPAIVEARARELGYVKLGEMPLRVTGLELQPPAPPARRDGGGFWDWLPDL